MTPEHERLATEEAEEILRVDKLPDGSLLVTLRTATFQGPGTWGIVLVDIAHHVADGGEKLGLSREATLSYIWEMFNAEWENRTDRTRPVRSKRKRRR